VVIKGIYIDLKKKRKRKKKKKKKREDIYTFPNK